MSAWLQATAAKLMTALFWVITQRVVVIYYRHLGRTNFLEDGTVSCPETSVRNYHDSLRNNPEERSSVLIIVLRWQYALCKVITDLSAVIQTAWKYT